jgi:hypothetical protein
LARILHIITLNIPYPPDYGGMIDSFCRIEALSKSGICIHLHCFEYNRPQQKHLETLCQEVNYYPRKTGFLQQLSFNPYIVSSRDSDRLLTNLLRDDYPILFDGLHTTLLLDNPALTDRKKYVRLHNLEHRYYQNLKKNERNTFARLYFLIESLRLKRYEPVLRKADLLFTISKGDQEYYRSQFQRSELILPFHPFNKAESLTGTGKYILFHGDLSVNENASFAERLIKEVFSRVPFKSIIAGRNPGKHLSSRASEYDNITFISNPDNKYMGRLIRDAHINIVTATATTGFNIKLLMVLFSGRHCIANSAITKDTGLVQLCHSVDSTDDMIEMIYNIMDQPFNNEMLKEREVVLSELYNNQSCAKKISELIFTD